MDGLYTIQEFANLRNINRNSLRYYERLGILIPEHTDPVSGYRYYSPRQLVKLDMILMCIDMGIPLKDFTKYVSPGGIINRRALMEDGKKMMEQKIRLDRSILVEIEHQLEHISMSESVGIREGMYKRHIKERHALTMPFEGKITDTALIENMFIKLFIKARETGSSPVLPSGIIIGNERGDMGLIKIFVELASAPEDDTDVITIPGGEYMCLQQEFERRDVLYPAIYDSFISRDIPGPYFVTNMHFGSGPYNRIIAEIQAKAPVS